ncbi:sensor domain-containing diguanylate cyclase [Neobacillus sp. MM2021_6]|uniref:sensor domain-containing diguanylate cyclase n=1 Tax=Bacillaceae TaxID=186817 RepID=UPI00140ABD14|nr:MULTISPECIES: sensor domain-containing diguanylate cyclase [Bacillaceae]MBO0962799.1 sensor domain-containing diguanylate cyclase [Neobacillus sp. MM2021_6]NHC21080.1 sensor domain-containing diguanylate cyclase [Bacillus sp. MM2020_4]
MTLNESSNELFQSIVEENPDAVLVFSVDGRIVQLNRKAVEILGYTVEEALGIHFRRVIVSKQKRVFTHFKKAVQGIPYKDEIDAYHKKGNVLHLQVKCIPLKSQHKIICYFCIVKDLTEFYKAKDSLRDSERRYRLLADNSLDLIQLLNLDGVVTYASPSHKTVLGYNAEEYIGKWVLHQPDGVVDEGFKDTFVNMVLTQKAFTREIHRIHPSGYDVWLELKGTPMFDEDGNFQHMMLVGREITERKNYQKELEFLSFHDALTGVPNRRLFKEKLEQALKEGKRYNRKFAVLFIDLDHFKRINDTYGHDIGDELLLEFSLRVKNQLRETDTLARHGGDEFTIILSELIDEEDALIIAKRILASLKEPWKFGEHVIQMTLSMGIAFYPTDGTTSDELLKHADNALYVVKESGRNNVQIYSRLTEDLS